jgi:IS5 family transposase
MVCFVCLGVRKELTIGFADLAVSRRKIKEDFFNQINILLDWRPIAKVINRHYQKGVSATGRPSYEGLLLFKICLLQTWYGLSDYEVEDQVNDRISFSRFVGLSLEDKCPDNSVISRFRTELTEKNAYEKVFMAVNNQLEKHQIIVKTGAIIDASVTDSPRKPKDKSEYDVVVDRREDEVSQEEKPVITTLIKRTKPGVDPDGRWLKKDGKLRFGFKQHTATDERGLVLGIVTTGANESDIKHLDDVLAKLDLPKKASVKADKGYMSKENDSVISKRKLRNHVMHKAAKGKPLTERELLFNKHVSKVIYQVERTFGSMRRWFGGGTARYVGLEKMHT